MSDVGTGVSYSWREGTPAFNQPMRQHLIAAQRNTSMSLGHSDLIAALARERQDALLRESEQQRLVREVRFAQTRPDAPGWAARVRRTLAFRRRPVHGQVGDC